MDMPMLLNSNEVIHWLLKKAQYEMATGNTDEADRLLHVADQRNKMIRDELRTVEPN